MKIEGVYKDHLGNVRLTYSDSNGDGAINPSSEIISEKNYYLFGLEHQGYNNVVSGNSNSVAENFGYNGKENNPELGIEWMDFGWRNYDAALGKWMNIDPLAENYYDQSAYNYTLNNPVFFIDPDGQRVDVSDLANSENDEDAYLLLNLAIDLSDISGQTVTFNRDDDGNTFLEGSGSCGADCTEASAFVSHLLDPDGGTITVNGVTDKGSQGFNNGQVDLNASQIYGIQQGVSEAGGDANAFSVGLSFLHESLHTKYGASFYDGTEYEQHQGFFGSFDDSGRVFNPGPGSAVTDIVNGFRRELGISTIRSLYTGTEATIYLRVNGEKANFVPINTSPPPLSQVQLTLLNSLNNDE